MVKILAFPGAWNARTEEQKPVGPQVGGRPLLSATPDGLVVISSLPGPAFVPGDWTNQELADLYRVESLLVQANIRISTARGLTDEGDPWFVFCKEDGDVFVHLARTDGSYMLDSPALGEILYGTAFTSLIERFMQIAAAKATQTSNIVTLHPRMAGDSVVRLHPAVMLAALVWSLYLASSKFGGVAHAAEDSVGHDHGMQSHHDGVITHMPTAEIPGDVDVALAHLVENMPKADAKPIAALLPERAVGAGVLETSEKNEALQRTAMTATTAGFYSQGIAASLTVVAFSYGLYISTNDEHHEQDSAGSSVPLSTPIVETHAGAAGEFLTAMTVSKDTIQTDTHENKPLATEAAAVAAEKSLPTALTSEEAHQLKLMADFSAVSAATPAVVASAAAIVSDFLSHREDSNVSVNKLLADLEKTTSDQSTTDTPISDTQSVLGLIDHYLGKGDVYKVGDLTVSTTFDVSELDKVLSHLSDSSSVQLQTDIASNANVSAAVAANVPTTVQPSEASAPAAAPAAAPTAGSTSALYAQYDDQAKQFVTHFIQESNSIQVVQFNSTIVLVDMSAINDPVDQTYTRSWSTDDGHVISTIGHLQDFVSQGMV
jgi:hypothetical protein